MRGFLTVSVVAAALAGCLDPGFEAPLGEAHPPVETEKAPLDHAMFAGKIDGTDAYVGFLRNGTSFIAYVCDIHSRAVRHGDSLEWEPESGHLSVWLKGELSGESIVLTGDDSRLDATLGEDTVAGNVTLPDGGTRVFVAQRAVTNDVGLFRQDRTLANGTKVVGGWIGLPDGSNRGQTATYSYGYAYCSGGYYWYYTGSHWVACWHCNGC